VFDVGRMIKNALMQNSLRFHSSCWTCRLHFCMWYNILHCVL